MKKVLVAFIIGIFAVSAFAAEGMNASASAEGGKSDKVMIKKAKKRKKHGKHGKRAKKKARAEQPAAAESAAPAEEGAAPAAQPVSQ